MFNFIKNKLDNTKRELKRFGSIADEIEMLSDEMKNLNDKELANKTEYFKERLSNGETIDDILVEAFAVAREAAVRTTDMYPFRVQLIGGLAIHYGNIAEMKTGEGKTIACVLPGYLNALTGDGVHIVTVNEYLASYQSEWMGKIYNFLGMSVGCNLRDLSKKEKREMYDCDILYTTNNEIGFDYLRDNMVVKKEERVITRGLNYAIVDEVDSVLIDEARTPLIISGGNTNTTNIYIQVDRFVKSLKLEEDYIIDEKARNVTFTDDGAVKCEKAFKIDNLYDVKHTVLVHHVNQALRANYSMKKDIDYVVQDNKIVIVDPFTGRLMAGRAFSEGLHQAIEAKEGAEIQQENRTMATITFQNLFRMYKKLSGMTGTAKTEEEEFRNIYNMYVIEIPTNMPIVRIDESDIQFPKREQKFKAIVEEIERRNKTGEPILVGTVAVETSELISNMLNKKKIKHEVLNAKNHAREAEIVANAGEVGAVTIATNMAGRGTDIKLGKGVKELGGLCVIGTERHESRRIDNQLRGRSGRQGDPGYSQFFVSFEDDLMVRFGVDRLKGILEAAGVGGERQIKSKVMTNAVTTAQKRAEGSNFDIRKQLLDYDNVLGEQREIIYEKRNTILDVENIHEDIIETLKLNTENIINSYIEPEGKLTEENIKGITSAINESLLNTVDINDKLFEDKDIEEVKEIITSKVLEEYNSKINELPEEIFHSFERAISLKVIDTHWMEHMSTMSHLREGIHLRGYAQENPLRAYTTEGFEMFDDMLYKIDKDISTYLLKAEIRQNTEAQQTLKGKAVDNSNKTKKKAPKRVNKIGRNEPCPCGSGKKYKQCCGK